jgi:hypothetical protein
LGHEIRVLFRTYLEEAAECDAALCNGAIVDDSERLDPGADPENGCFQSRAYCTRI